MTKKLILTASLAAILSMSTLFWAYGQERSITSVPLSFSWDGEPKGGELVGTVQASRPAKLRGGRIHQTGRSVELWGTACCRSRAVG